MPLLAPLNEFPRKDDQNVCEGLETTHIKSMITYIKQRSDVYITLSGADVLEQTEYEEGINFVDRYFPESDGKEL
jgi:hypothetical protein